MISRTQISWISLAAAILSILIAVMFGLSGWPDIYILAMVGIASIFPILFLVFSITGAKVQAYLDDDGLRVTGGMLDVSVPYTKMDRVELRADVDYGNRVMGYAGSEIIGGFYGNKEFGTYRVGAHLSTPPCIVVSYGKRTLVFNFDSSLRTDRFYHDLMQRRGTVVL